MTSLRSLTPELLLALVNLLQLALLVVLDRRISALREAAKRVIRRGDLDNVN